MAHLRRPTSRDCAAFLEIVRRSREFHRPWVYPPSDRAAYLRYVRHAWSDRHAGFLVCERASGEIVGVVNLSEIVRGIFRSAYLGFYGDRLHAGAGSMTRGVSLALEFAFRTLRLHRVEANIQPGNERSISLVKRCGFRLEGLSPRYLKIGGRWRDHERWAILREEWSGSRRDD